jgi:hypothetical protein
MEDAFEVWFRSAKHLKGETHLTEPLKRRLQRLMDQNKANVESTP